MAKRAAELAAEVRRFDHNETIDLAVGQHCPCWQPMSAEAGPFLWHPAGCICPCHGGRSNG